MGPSCWVMGREQLAAAKFILPYFCVSLKSLRCVAKLSFSLKTLNFILSGLDALPITQSANLVS